MSLDVNAWFWASLVAVYWAYALNERWLWISFLLVFGQWVHFLVCGTVRKCCQQACSLHYCDNRNVFLQFPVRPDLNFVPIDFFCILFFFSFKEIK